MRNKQPIPSKHLAYLQNELNYALDLLKPVSRDAWKAALDESKPFAQSPSLPFSTARVAAMFLLLADSAGTDLESAAEELDTDTVLSMSLSLTWDKKLRILDPQIVRHFRHARMPADFDALYRLPYQTYYLAMQGRAFGCDYDGMLVSREDIHSEAEVLTLELVKIVNGQGLAVMDESFPHASSWRETLAGALETGAMHLHALGIQEGSPQFASLMHKAKCDLEAWEPLVALAHAALVGTEPQGMPPLEPDLDQKIATVYGSLTLEGKVVFSEEAPSTALQHRLSRHRHARPQALN